MNAHFPFLRRFLSSFILFFTLLSSAGAQTQPPSFSLSISSETVGIGSCTELTFEIQNNSGVAANNLDFTLNLPSGVALTDPAVAISNCGGTFSAPDGGNTISLAGGNVAPNATCSARVGITLTAAGPFDLMTSDLTSSAGNSGNATIQVGAPVNGPSLGFSKFFTTSPIQLGGQTTLIYTIQNQSQVDAFGISFTDDLSPGIVVANQANIINSCSTATLTAIAGSQQITFNGGTLAAGQSCTLSLDVVGVTAGSNFSMSSDITSSFLNSEPVSSGRACSILEVIPPEDLANISFSKNFLENSVGPGGTATLEFSITNNSQSETFSQINFTDDLDAMLPGAVAINLPYDGGYFVNTSFGGNAPTILSNTWDYLDELQNENGRNDDYPVDGSGNVWNDATFETSTSTIGPWETGNAPFKAGEIDAFPPGSPAILDGIDAAPNGENLVTTYLFRQDFNLDATQADIPNWLIEHVFDDGGIVYINGKEVYRSPQMPAGQVTTTTLSGLGNESSQVISPVNLAGFLVAGLNTIAVEVHQTTLDSSDVGFSLNLIPASDSPTGGFSYADDTFEGTNDAGAANGALDPVGGFTGGAISATMGGKNFFTGFFNPPSSGGWSRTFTVNEAGVIPVSLRYRLIFDATYEDDESGQALFELNGVRYGNGPNNSLAQFFGGAGVDQDSGWQTFTTNISLGAGEHTILLGGYNNKSNSGSEVMQVFFDDIQIGTPRTPTPICGPNSALAGSNVLSLSGGQLSPGQTCSFQVGVKIPIATSFGEYFNTTSLISTEVIGSTLVGFPATDTLLIAPVVPAFSMNFGSDAINAAENSTLTFTIDNSGSQLPAENITLNHQLPPGLILSTPTGSSTTCQGGTLTAVSGTDTISYTGGTAPPGQICEVTVNVTSIEGGEFANTSDELISSLGNSGTASDTIDIQPLVAIALSIDSSTEVVIAGSGPENLTYIITAFNGGPSTATDIVVDQSETLPSGASMVSAITSLGSFDQSNWSIPTLLSGEAATLTITYSVQRNTVSGNNAITGTVILTSVDQLDSNNSDNTAIEFTSVSNVFDIALDTTGSIEPVLASTGPGNLVYTITASNSGPSDATNLGIRETLNLPTGVSVDSVIPSVGSFNPANDPNGLWSLDLPFGETATLTVNLTVGADAPDGGSISSTSILESLLGTDSNNSNDSATETTTIVAGSDLVVTQSGPEAPVVAGSGTGNLIYTVEVLNQGPLAATGIELTESLSFGDGITIDSVTPTAGSFLDDVWTLGALAVGSSETLQVILSVGPSAATTSPGVTSTASVSATDQREINPGDESATTTADIIREVDLAISATNSRDPVLAGFNLPQNLFHTITVVNNGPSDASAVAINIGEILPDGATIDSISPGPGTSFADSLWTVGDLGVGASSTIIYYFNVSETVAGGVDLIENEATVSGANETLLNAADDTAIISTDVVSPFSTRLPQGAVALDFQTGLFKQVITITNDNPGTLPSFRILVSELPDGVTVHNAQGANIDGTSYLLYKQALASGESIDLVVEYYQPDASGGIEPTFKIELLDPEEEQVAGEGVNVDPPKILPNGDLLIEFDSQIDQVFTVQYSNNDETWTNVVPDVVAGGTRLQWIDNGPPKTSSHPREERRRLYRVIQKDADQ